MTKRSYKVVGSLLVAGVGTGELVQLDDETVNIPALIEAGHVEPVRKPAFKESAPEKEVKEAS